MAESVWQGQRIATMVAAWDASLDKNGKLQADIDYKRDVTDADYSDAIARIDSLRMVNFVYNDDEQNRVRFGVIAEEAELTAPQYIKHNQEQYEDILDESGEKVGAKYRDRPSVDNNPIIMDLLGYVKDLRKEIDALRDELKALKEE